MPSILIVDDTEFDRVLLKSILVEAGYDIPAVAINGFEGIIHYRFLHNDLIMLDMIMPDMTGIQVLKSIKEQSPEARVIMCTTIDDESTVELALTLGAEGYVTKPYQAKSLLDKIQKVIGPPEKKLPRCQI